MTNEPPTDATSAMAAVASRPRSWTHRAAMTLVIFAGGAACGAAVATMVWKHKAHHAIKNPQTMSAHIAERLSGMLGLTDEQSEQVMEIILRRHNALVDMRREIQPRLETELSILEDEIAGVLNEDQRVKWRAHAAAMRAFWLPPIPEPAGEK